MRNPITDTRSRSSRVFGTSDNELLIFLTSPTAAVKRKFESVKVDAGTGGNRVHERLQHVGKIAEFILECTSVLILALEAAYGPVKCHAGLQGEGHQRYDTGCDTEWFSRGGWYMGMNDGCV